ncbi:hypothetical protein [Roseococcus sp. YIM B11640]|uniref:hypothetical protein n=1 Tax=Roseococcus sp. YIM B11640 TaxID=3133973 RepID=UPI003C7E8D93
MFLTRRDILLAVPLGPALPLPGKPASAPLTLAQMVQRLEDLSAESDALTERHALPIKGGYTAGGHAYLAALEALDSEAGLVLQQLIGTRAVSDAEIRLKAKVVAQYNVFVTPADLCPADALLRSLLQDLGAVA